MGFVSALKEGFALSPISDRQQVIDRLAAPNTTEAYYYQGLVILQKIHDEVMKAENPIQPRPPTQIERELSEQLAKVCSKLKAGYDDSNAEQLEARFNLLAYPFQTAKSIEFIKKKLAISGQQQAITIEDEKNPPEAKSTKFPSALDPAVIDNAKLIHKELPNDHIGLDAMAFPQVSAMWSQLNRETQIKLITMSKNTSSIQYFGPDLVVKLADLWNTRDKSKEIDAYLPNMTHLTLEQMDQLLELIPDIIYANTSFVKKYLDKIVPKDSNQSIIWDDHDGVLEDYLNRAESFANRLPPVYRQLKSAIKFYKLRIDITRQDFDENRLIDFLSCFANNSFDTSPVPSRYGSQNQKIHSEKSVTLPLFGDCKLTDLERRQIIEEYLLGLITHNKLTVTVESLGAYVDYHKFLKPLVAKIKLTSCSPIQDTWIKDFGVPAYESLVKESFVSFAHASLNASVKRKPSDTVSLFVKTKNIARLSVRVFQIDTENYWRMHKDEQNTNVNINLDGFRPTFEQDFDFSSEPAIRIKYNEFKFGHGELAPEVFNGRGLWVVEFVGGENQCRAIIQKGYLRHVIQNTFAGHVLRILDEEGQVIEKAKVIYNKQEYQTDDSSNILIPYQDKASTKNVLLVSSVDNYCEPANFHHLGETYKLEASFHVNSEMVSFNKTATAVVVPRLTLNNIAAPLSLLDDNMTLTIETISSNGIKNVSSCQQSSSSGDSICFDFMVPDQLDNIEFTLKGKVKTTNHKSVDVSTNHNVSYVSLHSGSGLATSFHLKRKTDNRYYIYVFGQNGEYKKNYELTVTFDHLFLKNTFDVQLQTNENGIIDLGELQNIKSVKVTDGQRGSKRWALNDNYYAALPSTICIEENAQFKLTCNTAFDDSLYSLYSVGLSGQILTDITASFMEKKNGYVYIRGLPEGKYKLNFPSLQNGVRSIMCTAIKPQLKLSERGIWSDWLIGESEYGKQNGRFLQKPLKIMETDIAGENVNIKLNNWSSKAFAIITTNTFVPTASESLYSTTALKQSFSGSRSQKCAVDSTRSLFLNDKRISEEYQYILNRAKAEKYTGSNLTKPPLLVYPKKYSDTYATRRYVDEEVNRKRDYGSLNKISAAAAGLSSKKCVSGVSEDTATNLAFLNHNSPLVVIPVSTETGNVTVDRKYLGHGGNLFQVVVISGEQTIFYQQLLNDDDTLKFNDLRQVSNSNKTLIRSKAVSKVPPKGSIILQTQEYETIDSYEKLFETIIKISECGKYVKDDVEFLTTWPRLNLQKKLEVHQEHVCHEVNLWLKKKDPQFFELYVKPIIKSKLQKSFMDLFLLDEDLSEYRENFYFNSRLSVAEKALLASSGPKEHLNDVLNSFIDSFENDKQADESDNIFDTILSQSTLAATRASIQAQAFSSAYVVPRGGYEEDDSDDDMGFGLFDDGPINVSAAVAADVVAGVDAGTIEGVSNHIDEDEDEDDDDEELDEDNYSLEEENAMRELAKTMNKKVVYKYTDATSQWAEAGYYNSHAVSLQQFWIDYLEHFATDRHEDNAFLSENFIYSLNSVQEILFVLCLMDLPFSSEVDWKIESHSSNKVSFCINAESYPLLVFYRTLSEYDGSPSINKNHNLMLSQEIFVVNSSTPINSEECIKIDPSITPLEPFVEYGSHLIVTNISAKALTCQFTAQVPTGAVPTQKSSYYQSKTISIEPYSTWHEVVNTFYFPSSGNFAVVPVTVSSITGGKLFAKIDAIPIHITNPSEEKIAENFDSNTITSQLWSKVAAKGTNESVIAYLKSYRKLKKLDMAVIEWRMGDKQFAQQVFDTLVKRRHYSQKLWEYGVVHQLENIIRDLVLHNSYYLLDQTGYGFASPLVSKTMMNHMDFDVFDYYPLFNARIHQLKSTPEILNYHFYTQYNRFLDYLCLKVTSATDADLVILTTYLLLQDRIGEASNAFSRIKNIEDNHLCQLQIDYLGAYLKTRILITNDSTMAQQLDLHSIKEVAKKYKDFGALYWRQLFTKLYNFACEVEQGEFTLSNSSVDSKRVHTEPILEFEIDEQEHELVVKYSNIRSVDVKYYDMDIEMMFSNNPFINTENNKSSATSNKNINWIKPSTSETIMLPERMDVDKEDAEEFDIIGVGQLNTLQIHRIPFTVGNKNVFIEVSGGNITRQHAFYDNSLSVHLAESFGVICVMSKTTKRPLAGVYIKVYCRKKGNKEVHFWKDGYTGLNGAFDYISVNQGNALTYNAPLAYLMSNEIEKLSILILSDEEGAIVKEVHPPNAN